MDFTVERIKDIMIVKVNFSRATLKESKDLKNILFDGIDIGERKIIVDLSMCEFVDSTFMGTLVVSLRKVSALNGDLKLVELHPSARSLFELARLFRIFETFNSREEAIESFNKPVVKISNSEL